MRTNIIYILAFLLGIFLISTCSEDLLEVEQKGVLTTEDFYDNTDATVEEAIAGVYHRWRDQGFNHFFLLNFLSDDVWCGGGGRGDNANYEQINEYQFGPENSIISTRFSDIYSLVQMSNRVIVNYDIATSAKSRAVAEAHVARAWAYFQLVTLWGPVPLVTEILNADNMAQPNADIDEIWDLIEADYQYALGANVLPSKSGPSDISIGARLTLEAVKAFYGKALLYRATYNNDAATYQRAAEMLMEVINSGKYELLSGIEFENVNRAVQDFGVENIFESNSINDPNNDQQGNFIFNCMIGWRWDYLNHDGPPILNPILSWGFASPTKKAYDAFVESGDRGGTVSLRASGSFKTYEEVQLPPLLVSVKQGLGPYGNEGYFSWKHRHVFSEAVTMPGLSTTQNYRWMRLGEVYLNAAEACFNSGVGTYAADSALKYINAIRMRAGVATYASINMDLIKLERQVELWAEMNRYQDLVRWGDATTVLANQGAGVPVFYGYEADGVTYKIQIEYTNLSYGFKSNHNELLPFPEREILVNPYLNQNYDW